MQDAKNVSDFFARFGRRLLDKTVVAQAAQYIARCKSTRCMFQMQLRLKKLRGAFTLLISNASIDNRFVNGERDVVFFVYNNEHEYGKHRSRYGVCEPDEAASLFTMLLSTMKNDTEEILVELYAANRDGKEKGYAVEFLDYVTTQRRIDVDKRPPKQAVDIAGILFDTTAVVEKMTKEKLYAIAKVNNVAGRSTMKKADLEKALNGLGLV